MSVMTPRDRVEAALKGQPVDRPPVSLWRHFPERDQTAEALAGATLDWQGRFGFDFIKLMPPGDYATIDWGAESVYRGSPGGTRETTRFPINSVDDWSQLTPVPVDRGMNREVVEAVRLVDEALHGEIPILQTIFSPLTIAMKLSNRSAIDHLRQRPDLMHQALETITQVTRAMVTASLERGAAGIFFASQCATTDLMTAKEYAEFGTRYDLPVLDAAVGSRFTLVHIHGEHILFDQLKDYPAQALNWHDRRTSPSLADGQRSSGRCVVGGIHEKAIVSMTAGEAAAQARDAIATLDGRQMMVGPGCVIPFATPTENVEAVVQAVKQSA